MNNPLVSIIVRTKDRPKLLKRALQSIAAQSYRPIEVVLVNDGGCDLDIEEIRTILGDVSLNYIRLEKNTGRAHAGNVGIENSKGEYLSFLDDDDEFYPEHVLTMISFLEKSDYKIAYTDAFFVYKDYDAQEYEIKEVKRDLAFSQDFDYAKLIFENFIPFMCLLFEKNVLTDSGGFDDNLNLYEDWDLLIRLGDKYPFHHIRKTTADYNQWSVELQISQRNKDQDFLRQSYLQVLYKHSNKITPVRVYGYVSAYAYARHLMKKLQDDCDNLMTALKGKHPQIENLVAAMKEKNTHIENLVAAMKEKDTHIENLVAAMKEKDTHIENLVAAMKEKDTHIENLVATGRDKDYHITAVENALREKESYIQMIHSGHGWKLLTRYFRLRDRLLPDGTKRKLFVKLFLKVLIKPKEVFKNVTRTNFNKFLYYLKTSDSPTLEKKIEQKLSDEFFVKASNKGITECYDSDRLLSKNYFQFLFEMNTEKGEDYVPISYPQLPETDIKLIAFYLPQFHPIQENDEWWGKGFTEWFNVARAVPQFIGHYQPRLPGELGYYDLRLIDVQKRQVELAKQYGVYGFCFHFYWFNGKTLLERPIQQFAENFNFPFCINWANENWTRRWDGKDHEVLISQQHSPEDDIAFIEHVSVYLRNKNYIKIQSKPLLIIYRPALFPNMRATAARWREWCLKNGIGEIYLAATHSFEHIDPRSIGFDAVIEFPPNTFSLREIVHQFNITNPHFKGVIMDYSNAIDLSNNFDTPPYKNFRGICPGWDNEPRKPGRGTILANALPNLFKQWLTILFHYTESHFDADEKMIFVNAWNEWAEGAYLEPDRRYGYAYLQAIADGLIEFHSGKNQRRIIYVCHDAHFHGAQLLSLSILKTLTFTLKFDVHFILKSGGELEPEYARYATVYNLEKSYRSTEERESLIEHLYGLGVRKAICSTVVSGDLSKLFHEKGINTVTLVHELPEVIRTMGIEHNAKLLSQYSDKVVFPSDFVKNRFKTITELEDEKTVILPQGLYKLNRYRNDKSEARKELRKNLSLPGDAKIVIGVGFGDYRKGVDLFVEVAKRVNKEIENVYFVWIGNLHFEMEKTVRSESYSNNRIIFKNTQNDISIFFAGADLYLLTSREDPFPTVVLDSMHVGLPVIGFDNAGGFRDIVNENTGALVPYLDIDAMAGAVIDLLGDARRRKIMGKNTVKLIKEKFNFNDYVYNLLGLLGYEYQKVSVIIPNYNYEQYLESRINSVLNQTYPVYEVIILDDASTDNSVKIAKKYLDEELNLKLIRNETNSGSVFEQWIKGLKIAQGDFIWIAEADDFCGNNYLSELLASFKKDKDVILAYCQSKQIDEQGKELSENYYEYTNDIDKIKWRADYIREGIEEISDSLVVKNTIPNISAVVFKKIDISPIAGEIIKFKVAGDWFFYTWLLRKGKISYVSKPLNYHRRHEKGITMSESKWLHYNEVVKMQESIMKEFDISSDSKEKAYLYRENLNKYFNLH